jgi:putative oxidoreductase
MDALRDTGALLGRIMLAFLFLTSAFSKISGPAATMQYMAAGGLPHAAVPALFALSITIELLGGLMLVFGWYAELAALVIFLWMIPVTIVFHVATGETIQWEKNLAIMGGLLMVAALGTGAFSFRTNLSDKSPREAYAAK